MSSRKLVLDTLEMNNHGRAPRDLWTLPWAASRYPDQLAEIQRTFPADMIGTPAYAALKTLSDTNADTIVRRRAKTGAVSLIPAKVSFNEEETLTEGQAVTVKGTFNAQNVSTRYAAA